ncbi:MAG: hypothetical protein FWD19_02780 [Defluviitaleaceae bacterium]|nr:hypothetical protein [Defluviitaleaceae bacterium]
MKNFYRAVAFFIIGCLVVSYVPNVGVAEADDNADFYETVAEFEYDEYFEYDDVEITGSSTSVRDPEEIVRDHDDLGEAKLRLATNESKDLRERLIINPDSRKPPTFYSVNGGKTWRKATDENGLWVDKNFQIGPRGTREFSVDISNLLNKKLDLRLSWAAVKKDAKTSPTISFPEINKRRSGKFERPRIVYHNNGTWTLERNGIPGSTLNRYQFAEGIIRPLADSDDWTAFTAAGKPVIQHGLQRESLWLRKIAEQDGTAPSIIYHPTSKPFRVRPRNNAKKPNMQFKFVHENKSGSRECGVCITINKGLTYTFGEGDKAVTFGPLDAKELFTWEKLEAAIARELFPGEGGSIPFDELEESFGMKITDTALSIQRPVPRSGTRPASEIQKFTFEFLESLPDKLEEDCKKPKFKYCG